jgi:hypothetical protein
VYELARAPVQDRQIPDEVRVRENGVDNGVVPRREMGFDRGTVTRITQDMPYARRQVGMSQTTVEHGDGVAALDEFAGNRRAQKPRSPDDKYLNLRPFIAPGRGALRAQP